MREDLPEPITLAERRRRQRRASGVARTFGFVGRVEYRHASNSAGGAQFGLGPTPDEDVLIVYADAFRRDADPADFSLEAILAHERGHQVLARHERLRRAVAFRLSLPSEEILASLIGSLLVGTNEDREALMLKAVAESLDIGLGPVDAVRVTAELRETLERLL
jgi:hypothetical protein